MACLGLAVGMSSNAVAAADAQDCLSHYYMKSYAKALPLCQLAALAGHEHAQFALGMMYAEGKGVQIDFQDAARWLEAASQQGHLAARYKLQNLQNSLAEQARQKQTASFWTDHKPMPAEKKITEATTEKPAVTEQITVKKQPLQLETFAEPVSIQPTKQYAPVEPVLTNRPSSALVYSQPTSVEPVAFEPEEINIIESKPEPIRPQKKPAYVDMKEDLSKSWPQYEGLNRSETAEIAEIMARDLADANRESDTGEVLPDSK